MSSTCGPAFGDPPDDLAPSVLITNPPDGAHYEVGTGVDILLDVEDDWGIADIGLVIDGEVVASEGEAPWAFENTQFPEGTWTFHALAEDYSGNVGESASVTITVGPVGSGNETGDDGSGDEGLDTGLEDGTGGGFDPSLEDGDGCNCSSGGHDDLPLAALGLPLLVLLRLRRRR
jgi:MYXO-CTERM domain-containing protein